MDAPIESVPASESHCVGITWTSYSSRVKALCVQHLVNLQGLYPGLHIVAKPAYESDDITWLSKVCGNLRIPVVAEESSHPSLWVVYINKLGEDEPLLPTYASDIIRISVEQPTDFPSMEKTLDDNRYPSLYRPTDNQMAPPRNVTPPGRPKGAPPMPPRSWNYAPFI